MKNLLFLITLFIALGASAQQKFIGNNTELGFLENKGQMIDMQGKPVSSLLFKVGSAGMDMYVTTNGLTYVFAKMEKHRKAKDLTMHHKSYIDDSIRGQYCRADMELVGADIRKENIVKEGESEDRADYYLGGICPYGILNVHSYGNITIKNIYPGIDWVLSCGKQRLEYDFIVHPGADPSRIKLKYKWTDKPEMQSDGSVKISTPKGSITEGIPVSYTSDAGSKIETKYVIENNAIGFKVGNYDTTETLIIDPLLTWATYYRGNNGVLEAVSSMQDDSTNLWITGNTWSTNFPTVNPGGGAYFQDTLGGSNAFTFNLFILQFTTLGVLKWATYYGGFGETRSCSISSDRHNVWVCGYTRSSNLPTFNPGGATYFQGTDPSPGVETPFILEFSNTGVRKWATYYGGTELYQDNAATSIHSDGHNVWVTGYTETNNFPLQNPGGGAYFQSSPPINGADIFILKFDTSGICQWSTYYGGSYNYSGTSIWSDGTNVWVTGNAGQGLPTLNPGGGAYFQATGPNNAFILKFSTSGALKWATYLGGNSQDIGNSVNSDGENVWVTGSTTSSNFPVFNPGGGAYFQNTLSSPYGDAFISQFDSAGHYIWGTYYGGPGGVVYTPMDEGYSIQSDSNNVWVCGETQSKQFPLYWPGCAFFQDTLGTSSSNLPPQDAFILRFTKSGIQEWGTYYGVDNSDGGSFISTDGSNLFICGTATSPNSPVKTKYPTINPGGGAYYEDSILGSDNVFIGKFCISCLAPYSLKISPNVTICRGNSTPLLASGGNSFNWSPSTGLSATNVPNPIASPTVTTTYTLNASDSGICSGIAVDSITVTVDTMPLVTITKDSSICLGTSITLNVSGGANYIWSTGATTSSINVTPASTITYTVGISKSVCTKDTGTTVTILPLPIAGFSGSNVICKGDSTLLSLYGGTAYNWSTGATTSSITVKPSSTSNYSVLISNGQCTKDTIIQITVDEKPNGNITGNLFICSGSSTTLNALGGTTYLWSTGATTSNIVVSPLLNSAYSVAIIQNGCSDTVSALIIVNPFPVVTACCDSSITYGQDVQLASSGGMYYSWSPSSGLSCANCPNPIVSPSVTTVYTLLVASDSGCSIAETITIDVSCGEVFVPNAFSPNKDGQNDVLYVRGPCIKSLDFIVFDRWGNKVFESEDINNGWDGDHNGQPMNTGTYVYYLKATMFDGSTVEKKGNVALVR